MHVAYVGPFAKPTGYAQAAHDYMLALVRHGVSLDIHPVAPCNTEDLDPRYEELIPHALEHKGNPTHVIVHTVPKAAPTIVQDFSPALRRLAITTWETTMLPPAFEEALDEEFDFVIWPSQFCQDATSLYDLRYRKSAVLPHCFDPAHWPLPSKASERSPYVFYSILGWAERKNPIGLLKAYLSEFTADDDVLLRILTPTFSPEDVTMLVAKLGYDPAEVPAFEFVTERQSHEDLLRFHHEGHCFVTATRGEGWNLPAFEAALVGNPVVAPGFSGHTDFLNDYCNAHLYGCQLTPAITQDVQIQDAIEIGGYRVQPVHRVEPSGINARQRWGEPDINELAMVMRSLYGSRCPRNFSSRAHFEYQYGYERVGELLHSHLESNPKIESEEPCEKSSTI